MARKSVTYKGKSKPYGATGWFHENPRHAMSAKGLRSTAPKPDTLLMHNPNSSKIDDELIKPEVKEETLFNVQPEEEPEQEVEYEETEVVEPKKRSIREQLKTGMEREKAIRTLQAKKKAGIIEEEETEELEELEEEAPTGVELFGKILTDITKGYDSSELVSLSDSQLKDLAIKFEAQEEGLFGKPPNPFKQELFARRKAQAELVLEQEREEAKMLPHKLKIEKEIAEIRTRAKSGKADGGILGDIKDFWSLK
jgi:hypothetical protein